MQRIKEVTFKNHPVLGNLHLDFTDVNGHAANTVIIAGENGVGKSNVIDALYEFLIGKSKYEGILVFEDENNLVKALDYYKQQDNGYVFVKEGSRMGLLLISDDYQKEYKFQAIYSDVEINFESSTVSQVTSKTLDNHIVGERSNSRLSTEINQLIVDIQAYDDAIMAREMRKALELDPKSCISDIHCEQLMDRFTKAFSLMFDNLKYSKIENVANHKEIYFTKNGKEIPIEKLSSGEKQIIYRGCFLLKNVKSLSNSFVFIDEPEISMHPSWQLKIMDYYKQIFTDESGEQVAQIFVVTHSPFIIHNQNRKDDKVVILKYSDNGDIVVSDKPEYYDWSSPALVEDAFNIRDFNSSISYVFLEGPTDERYFKKAVEVFGFNNLPFIFQWIGYKDGDQNKYTGSTSLDKAVDFIRAGNYKVQNACLYDCDTKKAEINERYIFTKTLKQYSDGYFNKGIENALVLDSLSVEKDIEPCYHDKEVIGDYNAKSIIRNFDKVEFCEHICSLDDDVLRKVMIHLKEIIEELKNKFDERNL